MRAFFCFFFLFTCVLCAQGTEPVDFEKFQASYQLLQKELGNAKDGTITIDDQWLKDHEKALLALADLSARLVSVGQPAPVRQAALNMNVSVLLGDLVFLKNRRDVEQAAADWRMKDVDISVEKVRNVLVGLRQIGLQFKSQPQHIRQNMYTLEILSGVLRHPKFSSRVCKDAVGCLETIEAATKTVEGMSSEMKEWEKKAKTWQPPPDKPEPALPDPESAKPKQLK